VALGFAQLGALCETLEDTADRCTDIERNEIVQRLREACADIQEWRRKTPGGSSMN
jgi:hypothetical protein